ncbi:hypothetical protein A165_17520 [Vibrio tasmaniensis ZS-17]|uniref:DUF6404 family protein n=1 Tax=Vibrio tasmaniensis TaxID=212663 RepID=UPI000377A373|nr:DUF6404 family protein [Vibrio tasmaniensis]OED61265.1 hypothetical protein A165_17520 [Vibrio tasmaniensis ZS-17]
MSYERKLERALQQLQAAKISKWNYNTPLHQWLRKAGIKLRPPYYVPFLRNVVVRFVEFFAFFLPLTSLLSISREGVTFSNLLYESFITGAFYAVFMSVYYLWTYRNCELTSWEEL